MCHGDGTGPISPTHNPAPTPTHTLVSTGSNTSPPTATPIPYRPVVTDAPQTFPTTIPSHPSTIQYIPLIPSTTTQPVRATFHLIPTTSGSETPRTVYQYERGTIHYPPTTVQIIQSVPPLIMTSGSVISANVQTNTENTQTEGKSRNVLQLIPTQRSTTTSTSPPPRGNQSQFVRTTEASETPPSSSPLSDQHIRVLTPSEIMRTLPSLGQEAYDPPSSTVSHRTIVFLMFSSKAGRHFSRDSFLSCRMTF